MFYIRKRVSIDCSQGGRTQQEFKDQVDINKMMDRFARTGQPLPMPEREPVYANLVDTGDFQKHMDNIVKTNDFFESLSDMLKISLEIIFSCCLNS